MFSKRYALRISLLGFLLFHLGILQAQTYYVSSISGDDNNDGTSEATAWATIRKVNQLIPSLGPGNAVLFERGGIYNGSINVRNVNGAESNPITFGAYGAGEAPVITGARQITEWEQIGENMWRAHVPTRPGFLNMLFINGTKFYPARFPNHGYRTVTHFYYGGFQDNTLLFPEGYWNGATVAYKAEEFAIRRDTVSYSYSDGRIDKFGENDGFKPSRGCGYFFQNHINALDTIGEFVYDKSDGSLILWTTDNPNEQLIEYTANNYGIKIDCSRTNTCYMVIENLHFQYYGDYAIYVRHGKDIEIRNTTLDNCWAGISVGDFEECRIVENTISDMEHLGIDLGNLLHSRIHKNTVRRIAMSLDGGQSGWCHGIALGMLTNNDVLNNHCEITENSVDSIGYDGIMAYFSQNLLIKNNVVTHTLLNLSDGGGIYVCSHPDIPPGVISNIQIIDNVVLNTVGNADGTSMKNNTYYWRHGIYLDDGIDYVTVKGNTVAHSGGGVFLHGSAHCTVHDNVFYDNNIASISAQDDEYDEASLVSQNDVRRNSMYQDGYFGYYMSIVKPDVLIHTNYIDSNYISVPFSRFFAETRNGLINDRIEWTVKTDFDLHSRAEPVPYALSGANSHSEYTLLVCNPTTKDSVVLLEHTYMAFDSTIYIGSITLPPFKSAILFRYQNVENSLDAPVGNNNLCIGTSAVYQVPGSVNLTAADTVVWIIHPTAAGLIKSVTGNKGSTVEIEWLPHFWPSPAHLTYGIRMSDSSINISQALTVQLIQDIGRPATPTGPNKITDITIPATFYAENPTSAEIEWIFPAGVGTLSSYDHHGNEVTVSWGENLLGKYPITYRLRNTCGAWGAEALPLYFSFPVTAPEGPPNVCDGVRTCFTAPPYTDMVSDFTWVLRPASAGHLEANGNEACVTLSKNAGNTGIALYYEGLNNYHSPLQSESIHLTVTSRPENPASPSGAASLAWNVPSSTYTADPGWDDYEWRILPSIAGTIIPNRNTATVHWNGDSDHNYAGQVLISYRGRKNDNSCGFSDYSPALAVILSPKPLTASDLNPCAGTTTTFSTKSYIGASGYRWSISPSNAGSASGQTNTTNITWSLTFSGEAQITCSVIDAAGRLYPVVETVQVRAATAITTQPAGATVNAGDAHTLNVATTHANSHQWQKWNDTGWGDLPGATNTSYTINKVHVADSGSYRVLVEGECNTVISSTAVITVIPRPCLNIITFQWPDVPTVDNNPAYNGGYTFVQYQWYKNGVPMPGVTRPYYQVPASEMNSNDIYSCKMLTDTDDEMEVCPFTLAPSPTPEALPFLVFPNPAGRGQMLTVQTGMDASMGEFEINIYDLSGGLRKQYRSTQTVMMVAAPDNAGYYLLQLKTKSGMVRNTTIVVQ